VCILQLILRTHSRACASGYMRYPDKTYDTNGVLRYYGHLVPSLSPSTCVARLQTSDGHQFLANSTCSMLDDASQENQYWQMEVEVFKPFYEEVSCVFLLLFLFFAIFAEVYFLDGI
jgi:hypothetical protein